MITVIHGKDNLTSRKYFLSQKDDQSITFDAEKMNLVEFSQSLSGNELFGSSKKVFVENLFTRSGTKNLISVAEILQSNESADVFIWADKEIGVKSLSEFPKFDNQNFKIPQNIWTFLDGIRPNNPRNIISFHKVLDETEPEIILAMLVRQFRLLLSVSSDSKKKIDEAKKLKDWQISKLNRQASQFKTEKLKEIYKKLYKIDKSQKTGASNLNLVQNIDILLLEI